jgi:hypothetical protein
MWRPSALTKQYLEVLHDLRQSNNLVILVPTDGGVPGDLTRRRQRGVSNVLELICYLGG